jgi:hypothetical protein
MSQSPTRLPERLFWAVLFALPVAVTTVFFLMMVLMMWEGRDR